VGEWLEWHEWAIVSGLRRSKRNRTSCKNKDEKKKESKKKQDPCSGEWNKVGFALALAARQF
jgi:hypothetical protein